MRNTKSAADYMTEIIKSAPQETRRGWELAAWREFEKDKAMRRAFFNYVIANFFKSHDVVTPSPNEMAVVSSRARHYQKSARPTTRAARKRVKDKQRTVIGLTMFKWIMQQRCGDLLRMGGAMAALGKLGKPNQIISNVISTVDARNILSRNGCEVPSVIPAEGPAGKAA